MTIESQSQGGGTNAAPPSVSAQAVSAVAALLGHEVSVDAVQAEIEKEAAAAGQHGGMNFEDAWDKPGASQQPDGDPMARYRGSKGYVLEAPVNGPDLDEVALSDFGRIAPSIGLSLDTAQQLVGMFAGAMDTERDRLSRGGDGASYDPQFTVSELRFEMGDQLEPTLASIEKFCAARPALAAYLDSTGLGNSPTVLRLLAAAAQQPDLLTKAGAKKFVESLGKNEKYFAGDKFENWKARLAFSVLG